MRVVGKLTSPVQPVPDACVTLPDAHDRQQAVQDVERNLSVQAGAGAGKTSLLVERLLEILRTGCARMEHIVAITFTDKAAAELSSRLRDELIRRSASDPHPRERELLAQALADFPRAHVGTIHAFCRKILQMRPLEARLDPGFRVVDGTEDRVLLDESWGAWLAARTDGASPGDRCLLRALRLGLQVQQWREFVLDVVGSRELVPWMRVADSAIDEDPWDGPDGLTARLAAFVTRFAEQSVELRERARPYVKNEEDEGWLYLHERAPELASRLQAAVSAGDDDFQLEWEILQARVDVKGTQKNYRLPSILAGIKKELKELKADLEDLAAEVRHAVATSLAARSVDFVGFHQRRKAERGVVAFGDLLIFTRDLLRDDRDTRSYFQDRFRFLLVDEFQDTDPLQAEIVFFLAEDGARAATWDEVVLRPGALFVVGDPKQSIYRFRRADVETYQEAARLISHQGGTSRLSVNFRSHPGIVRWVNEAFAQILGPSGEAEALQAEWQPMDVDPWRTCAGDGGGSSPGNPSVALLMVGGGSGEAEALADLRRQEAAAVSDLIRRAVAEGWMVSEGKGAHRRERPVRYGDVALLLPQTSGTEEYQEALRRRGIPYHVQSRTGFYRADVIAATAVVLAAVDNPQDTLAVASVLHSCLFGFSDEELLRLRLAGHDLDYRVRADGESNAGLPALEGLDEALALLAELHGMRLEVPPDALLDRLYRGTGILEARYGRLEDRQAVANLLHLKEMVRQVAALEGFSFKKLVRWLGRGVEKAEPTADAPFTEAGEGGVRLMTVHGSKGLEFPLVFVVNLGGRKSYTARLLVDRRARRVEWRVGEFETRGFTEMKEGFEAPRERAEARRLLYVACTRAQDCLVVAVPVQRKKDVTSVRGGADGLSGAVPPDGVPPAGSVGWLGATVLTPGEGLDAAPSGASGIGAAPERTAAEADAAASGGPRAGSAVTAAEAETAASGGPRAGAAVTAAEAEAAASGGPRAGAAVTAAEAMAAASGGSRAGAAVTAGEADAAASGEACPGSGDGGSSGGATGAGWQAFEDEKLEWEARSKALRLRAAGGPRVETGSELHGRHPGTGGSGRSHADDDDAVSGAVVGAAVHAVLEKLDLRQPTGVRALATLEAALAGHPAMADEVASLTYRALRTPVMQAARRARRIHPETPFSVATTEPCHESASKTGGSASAAADSDEVTLLEGRVDLLFEDEEGRLVLVDFKTDDVSDDPRHIEALSCYYAPQLRHYARAIEQASGRPVDRTLILFVRIAREAPT